MQKAEKKTGVGFKPAGYDYNIFLKPLLDPGEFVLLNSPTPGENCPMLSSMLAVSLVPVPWARLLVLKY